jgi:hypothetical protein
MEEADGGLVTIEEVELVDDEVDIIVVVVVTVRHMKDEKVDDELHEGRQLTKRSSSARRSLAVSHCFCQ